MVLGVLGREAWLHTITIWLLNVFVDKVTREAREEFVREVRLCTSEVGVLLYADDMVLME